jgi:beta-xylosidase
MSPSLSSSDAAPTWPPSIARLIFPSFLVVPSLSCSVRSETLDIAGSAYKLSGQSCPVHDPSFARDINGTFHLFSTDLNPGPPFLAHRCSNDGRNWSFCGHVFPAALPGWLITHVPGVTKLWAPDIFFLNGKWVLLYAASTFGSQVRFIHDLFSSIR